MSETSTEDIPHHGVVEVNENELQHLSLENVGVHHRHQKGIPDDERTGNEVV